MISSAASWFGSSIRLPAFGARAGRPMAAGCRSSSRAASSHSWAFFWACCSPISSSFAVVTIHNGTGDLMDFVREYWWVFAIVVALVLAFVLLRPRQRVRLTDSAPVRPHMAQSRPPEGRGVGGEVAAATSDVTGELLGAPVHKKLDGVSEPHDDLCRL